MCDIFVVLLSLLLIVCKPLERQCIQNDAQSSGSVEPLENLGTQLSGQRH